MGDTTTRERPGKRERHSLSQRRERTDRRIAPPGPTCELHTGVCPDPVGCGLAGECLVGTPENLHG